VTGLAQNGEYVSSARTNKSALRSSKDPAHYANFFQIGHNAFEVLLEFGQQENIHTRIYLSPQHAQILCDLLIDTLQQHRRLFGTSWIGFEKHQDKPH
jgi:hypothetical protein